MALERLEIQACQDWLAGVVSLDYLVHPVLQGELEFLVQAVRKVCQEKLVFRVTKATVAPQVLQDDLDGLESRVKWEEEDLTVIMEEEVHQALWVTEAVLV